MEDPEPGYVKSKKELKREEKARARRMREEEKEILQEEKARKRKGKKAEKRKVRTGGFVDEIDEDDITEHSSGKKASAMQQTAQTAASEAHEELKKKLRQQLLKRQIWLLSLSGPREDRQNEKQPVRSQEERKNLREWKKSRLQSEALRCHLFLPHSLQAV